MQYKKFGQCFLFSVRTFFIFSVVEYNNFTVVFL